jgi:hypothetical protein
MESPQGHGASESHMLKVAALPSPKRLPGAQGFGRRGFVQAGAEKRGFCFVCGEGRKTKWKIFKPLLSG